MIFLTVGTQFPFDRLVKAVDELVGSGAITDEVFAQIGDSTYTPRHFQAVPSLDKGAFDDCFLKASAIISHAGMGTITMALDHGKSLLAMPRRSRYGEVVNGHQEGLARKFAACGHILVAEDERELPEKVKLLPGFVPRPRQADPDAVARRISLFVASVQTVRNSA
jgi:UDP-N-acetylglucosamine transferase subunit ALG13